MSFGSVVILAEPADPGWSAELVDHLEDLGVDVRLAHGSLSDRETADLIVLTGSQLTALTTASRKMRAAGVGSAMAIASTGLTQASYDQALAAGCDDALDVADLGPGVTAALLSRIPSRKRQAKARIDELEQQLDETLARERRTEELARLAYWELDLVTEVLTASANFARILGEHGTKAPDTLDEFLDMVHEPDREHLLAGLRKVLTEGGAVTVYRILCADGHLVSVVSTSRLERDDAGNPVRSFGTTQDMSERLDLERALSDDRDRGAALLAAVTDGYVQTRDGVIVDVNDALCELTGFSRDELVGSREPLPFWPPHLIDHIRGLKQVRHDGGTRRFELLLQRRDGALIECVATSGPVVNADGVTTSWINLIQDVTALRTRERGLRAAAVTDSLTGLLNHAALHGDLAVATLTAAETGGELALLVLDIDHFKSINDRFGHPVGDEVLRALADRLLTVARHDDPLGRTGGEEFALVMPGVTAEAALLAAERLRLAVGQHPFSSGRVTCSIGVASLRPGESAAELFSRADDAMYAAKSAGRDRVIDAETVAGGNG